MTSQCTRSGFLTNLNGPGRLYISIIGLMVEYYPATVEIGVRFPDDAFNILFFFSALFLLFSLALSVPPLRSQSKLIVFLPPRTFIAPPRLVAFSKHHWSNGRILPCHGRDRGSIPR